MNKTILIGRLTKEPKIASTESGVSTAQFTIAVNRNFKNKDGNYDADFINCVAFRNTADFIGKYIKKGNQIGIEGRIQTRTYEKDKNTIYVTEVVVENITILERKQQEQSKEEQPKEVNEFDTMNTKTEYQETEITLSDNDLPF